MPDRYDGGIADELGSDPTGTGSPPSDRVGGGTLDTGSGDMRGDLDGMTVDRTAVDEVEAAGDRYGGPAGSAAGSSSGVGGLADAFEEIAAAERDAAEAAEEEEGLPEEWYTGTETQQEVDLHSDGSYDIISTEVDVYVTPEGYTLYVDPETGEILDFDWPDGEQPVYQGDVIIDGEPHAVYELPGGEVVIIDGDGNVVSSLEEATDDLEVIDHPVWGEVYYVPAGPPSYDTEVYDAETGEKITNVNTGDETLGAHEGYISDDDPGEMNEVYSTYQPPGADYYLIIDDEGNVIDQQPIPPEEVWSLGGVVTYYDDGAVTVDVGAAEATIDVIGAEGGISFEVGSLDELVGDEVDDWLGSFGAELNWDQEGIDFSAHANISEFGSIEAGGEIGRDGFELYTDIETQIPVDGLDVGASVSGRVGITEDGQAFVEGDVELEFKTGGFDIVAGVDGYLEVGPGGIEVSGGWDGSVGFAGLLQAEGGQRGSFVVNEDGMTVSYDEYRGIGITGLGSVRAGYEAQLHTDGTVDGTRLSGGIYGETVDADGDQTGFTGAYTHIDEDGITGEIRDERLDTGVTKESYDRHHDTEEDTSGIPSEVTGGDASVFGVPGAGADDAEGEGSVGFDPDRFGPGPTGSEAHAGVGLPERGEDAADDSGGALPDAFDELVDRQTGEAGPEHAPGAIPHPDGGGIDPLVPDGTRQTGEAGPEHAPGAIEQPGAADEDDRPGLVDEPPVDAMQSLSNIMNNLQGERTGAAGVADDAIPDAGPENPPLLADDITSTPAGSAVAAEAVVDGEASPPDPTVLPTAPLIEGSPPTAAVESVLDALEPDPAGDAVAAAMPEPLTPLLDAEPFAERDRLLPDDHDDDNDAV